MKYFLVFLILIGISGFSYHAYAELDKSILEPFENSDLVIIGTVIQVNTIPSENKTQYNIKVQEYLKGQKSFDMITAILDETRPVDFPHEPLDYYNSPYFEKDNQVFVYLKQEGATFKMSPYSFTIKKPTYAGPPTLIHPTGPQGHYFSQGDEIVISGTVKKGYLYGLEKSDLDSGFHLVVLNERGEQIDSEKLIISPDGNYKFLFQNKGDLRILGNYFWEITFENGGMGGEFVVVADPKLWTPLKQIKSGISSQQVSCKDGLELVVKSSNNSPACVKPESIPKLIERGWTKLLFEIQIQPDQTKPNSEINVMCMTLEKSKDTATFFKVPSYLPDGYSFKCSFSGTPYESYMIFHNKKVPDELVSHYPQLISEGAIFIHQTDEKRSVGEKEFATYGSASQRIQDTYDGVMMENPSLRPQLIKINGMLAYTVDSCSDCGKQTANFTDGTIIQKSTFTETKIKFIDENGVKYLLKAGIPLNELIKVAESLQ